MNTKFVLNVQFLFTTQERINKLLETNKEIKEQKYTLAQINSDFDFVKHKIKEFLSSKMWHNLKKVDGLYRDVYEIKLNFNEKLLNAIQKRHDIVHRNGKTVDGVEFVVQKQELEELIKAADVFISDIEDSFIKYQNEASNKIVDELF